MKLALANVDQRILEIIGPRAAIGPASRSKERVRGAVANGKVRQPPALEERRIAG